MARGKGRPLSVAVATVMALALSACGNINNNAGGSSAAGTKNCGTFNIAVNPWVGYEADAYVVGAIAKSKLGCSVNYLSLKEQPSWAGMNNGTVDTVLENWGHQDLAKQYITQQKTVVNAGQTGNQGIIGWFIPPWMVKKYPGITSWKNLNKYASVFKTSESGGKGQLLDGDPSYVTEDAAIIKGLKLNYQVVVGGSEAALIQSFRNAEKNKTPLLAYFYEPQWFFSEMKLVQVQLPPYKTGCDSNTSSITCGYPPYHLNKLLAKKFADSGSPAATLVKNFHWTNADQNLVSTYIAKDSMSPSAAAQKWIAANPTLVSQWLKGTGAK